MKRVLLFTVSLSYIFLSSCVTTKIVNSWKPKDIRAPLNYKRILVVGNFKTEDQQIRTRMELQLVTDLIKNGYEAVSSVKQFGAIPLDTLSIDEKFHNGTFDAIIILTMLYKSPPPQPKTFYRVMTKEEVAREFEEGWRSQKRLENLSYHTPAEFNTPDTKYLFETMLLTFNGNNVVLLYKARSSSFNPLNKNAMVHGYAKMVVKDLIKEGVLQKKNK
ncbi:hypothetical protein GALL_108360 [mine drainage metagenome]|uniref:Lipoprotein n=1 Tax=mine drainage metagenome TaxID=410659 RepID=A0A1J5SF31_9ZZZZ